MKATIKVPRGIVAYAKQEGINAGDLAECILATLAEAAGMEGPKLQRKISSALVKRMKEVEGRLTS